MNKMSFDFLDFGFPKSGTDWKSINGKPYITVSSKGRSNRLSNKINDGADFGPDTTLGATSPNQTGAPYSQSGGQQEAWDYCFLPTSQGYLRKLVYTDGGKFYTDVPLIMRSSYVQVSIEGQGGNGIGSQIQCSSNFTGNYLIDVALSGNLRFSGIRLTPVLPNGTAIDYGLYFDNQTSDEDQWWENFIFDKASIAQLYQNTTVNGRTFIAHI